MLSPRPSAATVFAILLLLVTQSYSEASFSFSSFPADSCSPGGALLCMHNSTVIDGYVALIREEDQAKDPNELLNNIGRVLYGRPAISWPASFDTNFTLLIRKRANSTHFGDGMAFVMTTDQRPSPKESVGAFLGLFDQSTNGDEPADEQISLRFRSFTSADTFVRSKTGNTTGQIAVEIDTFANELDSSGNFHVGVDISGIVSNISAPLDRANISLKEEKPITYRVLYDGWTMNLQVMAGYAGDGSPLGSVLNFTIVLALMRPVYVGFTAASGPALNYSQSVRLLSWNFSFTPLPESSLASGQRRSGMKAGVIVVVVLSAVVGLSLLLLLGLLGWKRVKQWRRWKWLESLTRNAASAPKMYTYEELSRATRHFSSASLVGEGGFGSVYRGQLSDPPSVVAVKRISANSKQGEKEYFSEICTIGRVRQRNIVQLQGWCHSGKSLLLVYEFMVNGSLDRHIAAGSLDWTTRCRILLGLASALLYLHEECGDTVVHRDVKPNNVLLDADFEAHLGDFGLARLARGEERSTCTTVLAGTIGYLAPEFGYTGKATPESDVFSYGVVVLEVVCGRRSLLGLDGNNLLDHVWKLYAAGELLRAVDPKLGGKFDEEARRTLLVGLMCAHPNPSSRPRCRQVVQILGNRGEPLMPIPEEPPETIVPSWVPDFGGINVRDTTVLLSPGVSSASSSFLAR